MYIYIYIYIYKYMCTCIYIYIYIYIYTHITGSNNVNTYKSLPVSCFRNRQTLHVK